MTPYDRIEASEFSPGETVFYPLGEFPPQWPGIVVAVHPKINKVDVRWQAGVERMDPDELVRAAAMNLGIQVSEQYRPVVKKAEEMKASGKDLSMLSTIFPDVPAGIIETVREAL